jgi:hypothetical protein
MGRYTLKRLKQAGVVVPEDIAVTGYDNRGLAILADPELTSVDGKVNVMARTCAQLVIAAAESRDVPTLSTVPDLVVRASMVPDATPPATGPPSIRWASRSATSPLPRDHRLLPMAGLMR